MIVVGIDTGFNIGFSVVDLKAKQLLYWKGVKVVKSNTSMEVFCDSTIHHLNELLYEATLHLSKGNTFLIELPRAYGSRKSEISLKQGKLFYTYASAIIIYNALKEDCSFYSTKIKFIAPDAWKGQLSKEATEYRVCEILGSEVNDVMKLSKTRREHIMDSIGIALSYDKKLWNLTRKD